jgi:hypothetical protein
VRSLKELRLGLPDLAGAEAGVDLPLAHHHIILLGDLVREWVTFTHPAPVTGLSACSEWGTGNTSARSGSSPCLHIQRVLRHVGYITVLLDPVPCPSSELPGPAAARASASAGGLRAPPRAPVVPGRPFQLLVGHVLRARPFQLLIGRGPGQGAGWTGGVR